MRISKIITAIFVAATLSVSANANAADTPTTTNTGEATSSRIPVPTGKYITGGVLASTVGFGIGHGIQGRYADKGWMFTATEAAGAVLFAAGARSCDEKTDIYGTKTTECSNAGIGLVGFGVWLGFHVWEIVDAWTGATPVDDGPKAFLIPNPQAPGLGLAWSF